jgi:ABC-type uncharacterized transport system substrate-binding protein
MKKNDPPQSTDRASNMPHSAGPITFCTVIFPIPAAGRPINEGVSAAHPIQALAKTLIHFFAAYVHYAGRESEFSCMATRRNIYIVMAAMTACVSSTQVSAHPHVWIEMQSDVVFTDDGLIKGVDLEWTFDDGYTQMALDGLDVDGDGTYSQSELAPLTKENIASLKDYEYFTVIRANGEQQKIGEVTDFGQIWSNNKLTLHLQVPLEKPIDPKKDEFMFKVYDPEFFIAIDYVKDDPVDVVGKLPESCKLVVKPVPTDAELDQTRTMLSTKGKDWKPEVSEDFGALFAQAVSIACKA